MDEKLKELLYSVQSVALEVGNAMGDAAVTVGHKANEWVQVGKARAQIVSLKTEVNILLRQIGDLVYGTHVGQPSESELLFGKLGEIDELKRRIAELEAMLPVKAVSEEPVEECGRVCAQCSAKVGEADVFCSACGSPL